MWIVLLAAGLPVWTHNFHLDRFLIPGAPVFWILAALGFSQALTRFTQPGRTRAMAFGAAACALLLFPSLDGPWVARRLGLMAGDAATQAYITDILAHKHELGASRRCWTPGLPPETTSAILDVIAAAVGPEDDVAWLGNSSEISPAALHLALLAKSGNRERFLARAHQALDVTFTGDDPDWTAQQLAEFVAPFDVVISTDPPDLAGRASRAFMGRCSALLVDQLGWIPERVGQVTIAKDPSPPLALSIYALRPPE